MQNDMEKLQTVIARYGSTDDAWPADIRSDLAGVLDTADGRRLLKAEQVLDAQLSLTANMDIMADSDFLQRLSVVPDNFHQEQEVLATPNHKSNREQKCFRVLGPPV